MRHLQQAASIPLIIVATLCITTIYTTMADLSISIDVCSIKANRAKYHDISTVAARTWQGGPGLAKQKGEAGLVLMSILQDTMQSI